MIYDILKIWRKRIADLINELINDEAVYRTAPATPGLLTICTMYTMAPSCDSGAAVDNPGAVGHSCHLAGAALLPGAVLVGGGRGHGAGGGCGETEGGYTAVQ